MCTILVFDVTKKNLYTSHLQFQIFSLEWFEHGTARALLSLWRKYLGPEFALKLQVCLPSPFIPALGAAGQRQMNLLSSRPVHSTLSSRPARDTIMRLCLRKPTNQNITSALYWLFYSFLRCSMFLCVWLILMQKVHFMYTIKMLTS